MLAVVGEGGWGRHSDSGTPIVRLNMADVSVAADLPLPATAAAHLAPAQPHASLAPSREGVGSSNTHGMAPLEPTVEGASVAATRLIPVRLHVSCLDSGHVPSQWSVQALVVSLGAPAPLPALPARAQLRPILILPAAQVRMGVAGDDTLLLGKLAHEARWRWREWGKVAGSDAVAALAQRLSPSTLRLLESSEALSLDVSGLHVMLPRAFPLRLVAAAAAAHANSVKSSLTRLPAAPRPGPEYYCLRRLPVPTALSGNADAPREAPLIRFAGHTVASVAEHPPELPRPQQTLAVAVAVRSLSLAVERGSFDAWLESIAPVTRRTLSARAAAEALLAAQVRVATAPGLVTTPHLLSCYAGGGSRSPRGG